jgi:hypothetical protein
LTDAVFRATAESGPSCHAQSHRSGLDLRGRERLSSVGFPSRLAPTLAAGDYFPVLDGIARCFHYARRRRPFWISCYTRDLRYRRSLRRLRAVLSLSPIPPLERWSYSLYLWHWIVLCPAWELAPGRGAALPGLRPSAALVPLLTTLPALLGISLLFAAASYYWIDRPMLSLRRGFGSRAIGRKSGAFIPPIGGLTHAHVLDLSVGASHDSTM